MKTLRTRIVILTVINFLFFHHQLIAQTPITQRLKVFAEGSLVDFNYIRNNTKFVDFVNDPKVADVHVLVNRQRTGSNGINFTLDFYGTNFPQIGALKLSCKTFSFDTEDLIRKKLSKTLQTGLLLFVNEKNGLSDVDILASIEAQKHDNKPSSGEITDRWNQWIFSLGAYGGIRGEEQKQNYDYQLSLRAKKTTDAWKIINEYDYERSEGVIKKDNAETIHTLRINQDIDMKYVKSINPHWSWGVFLQGTQSTYRNMQMNVEAVPAIQYNLYDWKVSDRRTFTFSYYTGPAFYNYYEKTIFDKKQEWLWKENIEINLNKVEPWGEIDATLEAGHFFPGFENYFYLAEIDLGIRITKGLSINFEIQAESIHNQIYLPASKLSDEDLLLNTRKLPTTFEYSARMGIRFQFGSIYNNVVNERL